MRKDEWEISESFYDTHSAHLTTDNFAGNNNIKS